MKIGKTAREVCRSEYCNDTESFIDMDTER